MVCACDQVSVVALAVKQTCTHPGLSFEWGVRETKGGKQNWENETNDGVITKKHQLIIHGEFWTGNTQLLILFPSPQLVADESQTLGSSCVSVWSHSFGLEYLWEVSTHSAGCWLSWTCPNTKCKNYFTLCAQLCAGAGWIQGLQRCHICLPGQKKKSGAHIFHHFKCEVYLRSLKSLTGFYTCRGGFYFEHPLNTLWVGVFPVLEWYMFSDK